MKIEVWLENNDVPYDDIKNWLSEFNPEDKLIDDEEIEFYITLNKIEDIFDLTRMIDLEIIVDTYCDEPLIRII